MALFTRNASSGVKYGGEIYNSSIVCSVRLSEPGLDFMFARSWRRSFIL